jgi:heme A synthase
MIHLVGLLQMHYADPIDLACYGIADAETLSMKMGVASLLTLPLTWIYRGATAREKQNHTWSAVVALLGVVQILVGMFCVPFGCLSGNALTTFFGYATPWFISAMLFRSAVAPVPPTIQSRPGDPFA